MVGLFIAFSTTTVAAQGSRTWTGSTNTDWNTGSNWSGSNNIPSSATVTIPASPSGGRFPVISSAVPAITNIIMESGAMLTVNSGGSIRVTNQQDAINMAANSTLQINGGTIACGEINLTGTIRQTGGTLHLNGNGTDSNPNEDIEFKSSEARINQTGGTIYVKGVDSSRGLIEQNGTDAKFMIRIDFSPSSTSSNPLTFTSTRGTIEFMSASSSIINIFTERHQFNNVVVRNGANANVFPSGSVIRISGDFTNESATLNAAGATFTFNGIGDQNISSPSDNASLGSLTINKANGRAILTSNVRLAGNFNIEPV